MSERRIRLAPRAVVLDEDDRVLLVRFGSTGRVFWATPGGGIEVEQQCEVGIEVTGRRRVHETYGVEVEPASVALVRERRVGEAIAYHERAARECRPDHRAHKLGPGCGKREQLGEW